jgi:hypothetical protein
MTHERPVASWRVILLAVCALLWIVSGGERPLAAQTPGAAGAPPAGRGATPARGGAGQGRGTARAPMTKADVQRLWSQGRPAQKVFVTDLEIRGLAFEPEEDWLAGLPAATKVATSTVPDIFSALQKLIPPAPAVDSVARDGPALLNQIKTAAQARGDLSGFVHPELLAEKAKVYDLFDTANYRSHALGKASPAESRRVTMQFFQLTTNEVERLHYVLFTTSRGKLVVRDIVTGPAVANQYLKDEQQLALSKLELVFRALNDGDNTALQTLCSPGLLGDLTGLGQTAAFPVRGLPPYSQIKATPSVPLDQKAIRVVVRVEYALRNNERIDFDVDFERIDNDLRVVRLRDVKNDIIAVDPDIDNHVRRRFGLAPVPPIDAAIVRSSDMRFLSLQRITQLARYALEDRNVVALKDWAGKALSIAPENGDGYGFRAAASHLSGDFDTAQTEAINAIARGGTVYFTLMRHQLFNREMRELLPVILAISKDRVQYIPMRSSSGLPPEEFPAAGIEKTELERGNIVNKARPFLSLEFKPDPSKREKKEYNFAAFGTTCPADVKPAERGLLVDFNGGSICAPLAGGGRSGPIPVLPNTPRAAMLVPRDWDRSLRVVVRTLEEAKKLSGTGKASR